MSTLPVPSIWHSAAGVKSATEQHLTAADSIRQNLLKITGEKTVENTLEPFNDILVEIDGMVGLAELISNVYPDAETRKAAENSYQKAAQFINGLKLDRGLYEALSQVKTDGLDPEAVRFLTITLRDYRRAGVDKNEATRKELADLYDRITKTGQEFSKNIREDHRFILLSSKDDLAGLPDDYVAAHPPGKDGKIKITTDYADYNPFMIYCPREDLRHDLYIQFQQRAYPVNDLVLKELLNLRHQYAVKLGYPNWSEYTAEDKMVKNASTIDSFIDRVVRMAKPCMTRDLNDLLARKKQDIPPTTVFHEWDNAYYTQKIRFERFDVNPREVRPHYEFTRVKNGILKLAEYLFNVSFTKVSADVWHHSVEAYDVQDCGNLIGRLYLDLHPRQEKYSHIAVFPAQIGLENRQIGVAALVGNWPGPGTAEQPALLESQDAIDFLHEFGHVMHHLLAYKHRWVPLSGLNCEWDFVEAPSQLLEEWGRDAAVLNRFACHYKTGAPISAELVTRMRQAGEFGKGISVNRQLAYARASFDYHFADPKQINLLEQWREVQQKYSPFGYEPDTFTYDNFGHLEGYSSMYYTYMWSLTLSKDLLTRFQANGLLDKKTALDYREKVLGRGGAKDGVEMVRDFLGRDFSFEAFRKWLEE